MPRMARPTLHRCDRCGSALAQDNLSGRCAACGALDRDTQRLPPSVPADFWTNTDAITEAFASRHMGRVIRAFRLHPHHGRNPLSQEIVAGWLGITQSRLSRVENGPRIDQLDVLIHWARVLRI